MKKKLLLLTLVLVSTFGSLKVAQYISEKYFFDKIYYQKSNAFGYGLHFPYNTSADNTPQINSRITELQHLISETKSSQKVLGATAQSPEKSKEYKVAIIGDSVTYGLGVKPEEAYPTVFEKQMNAIRPTKVYNLAIPGDDIIDNYTKYLMAEQYIKPDLYVITLIDNDLDFNATDRYPNKQATWDQLKSGCPQPELKLPDLPSTSSWQDLVVKHYFPSFSSDSSSVCILHHIADRLPKDKTIFITLDQYVKPQDITPANSEVEKDDTFIMESYKAAFTTVGGFVLDLNAFPDFVYTPVSQSEGHPSATTQQEYAKYLFREVSNSTKWGFVK